MRGVAAAGVLEGKKSAVGAVLWAHKYHRPSELYKNWTALWSNIHPQQLLLLLLLLLFPSIPPYPPPPHPFCLTS